MNIQVKLEEINHSPRVLIHHAEIMVEVNLVNPYKKMNDDFDVIIPQSENGRFSTNTYSFNCPKLDFVKWAKSHPESSLIIEIKNEATNPDDCSERVTVIINKGKVYLSQCEMKYLSLDDIVSLKVA